MRHCVNLGLKRRELRKGAEGKPRTEPIILPLDIIAKANYSKLNFSLYGRMNFGADAKRGNLAPIVAPNVLCGAGAACKVILIAQSKNRRKRKPTNAIYMLLRTLVH